MNENQTPSAHENTASTQGLGLALIAIAVLSYVLPMIGIQFRLVTLVQNVLPSAPLVIGGIGALFVAIGVLRGAPSEATDASSARN